VNYKKGRLATVTEPLVLDQCLNDGNSFAVDTDAFNWRLACVCVEDQYEFWNKKEIQLKSVLRNDIHYAAVDAVHLMNVSIALSDGKVFCQLLCGKT
jgi:hypothetical protein